MKQTNKTTFSRKGKRVKSLVKDTIIYLTLFTILIIFVILPEFYGKPISEWSDGMMRVVGDLSIYLLGMIGLFEFGYDNGLLLFIPNSFVRYKEKRLEQQTKEYIFSFLDKETEFLHEHERLRAGELMSLIGLSVHDLPLLQSNVIKARLDPMYDIETATAKLEDILFHSNVVRDLHVDSEVSQRTNCRFYFRFPDLMHDPALRIQISKIMATFVCQTLENPGNEAPFSAPDLDIVMTPTHGNYLLGFDVNALLGKHFIKMIPKNKVFGDNYYEGVIPGDLTERGINVILVHDILVSGGQIIESIDEIRSLFGDCKICVFSLIYRNFDDALTKLQRRYSDVKFYNMLEYSEQDIYDRRIRMSGAEEDGDL